MRWDGLEHVVRQDEPLAPRCALRIGGVAEFFAEPTNREELLEIVKRGGEAGMTIRLLGGGSNLLVSDSGVGGITLCLSAPEFSRIEASDQSIRAGGGAALTHVIATAAREGLAGLEGLAAIPGTVGGALHGNAGDHNLAVGMFVHSATVLTRSGEQLVRERADMTFAYRDSSLDELAILDAEFVLEPEDREELTRRLQKQWIVKRAGHPPMVKPAAYLFKDPLGMTAAELIEDAGAKGMTSGGASLFDRDANFVITSQDATASDVRRLMDLVREKVALQLGVELETNIQIW